jgi:hypothetical protein
MNSGSFLKARIRSRAQDFETSKPDFHSRRELVNNEGVCGLTKECLLLYIYEGAISGNSKAASRSD